jgi:hypothetical protein
MTHRRRIFPPENQLIQCNTIDELPSKFADSRIYYLMYDSNSKLIKIGMTRSKDGINNRFEAHEQKIKELYNGESNLRILRLCFILGKHDSFESTLRSCFRLISSRIDLDENGSYEYDWFLNSKSIDPAKIFDEALNLFNAAPS